MSIKKLCIIIFSYITSAQGFTVTEVPGSPFFAGVGAFSVAFTPLLPGNILFAATANVTDNTIAIYQVDTSTGAFTPIAGSPFPGDNSPVKIAFSPIVNNNLFAAVSNATSGLISVYLVNQTTGFFKPVVGSPFFSGSSFITSVTFSPVIDGNLFLSVVNQISSTVSSYVVNPNTGFLTPAPGSPFFTDLAPLAVAFSPVINGNLFAAVTNSGTSSTSIFSVNPATGAFTQVAGSPFTTPVSFGVAFSPLTNSNNNLFLILGNNAGNTTSVYSVQNTGILTPVPNSPFATGGTTAYGTAFSDIFSNTLFAAVSNLNSNNMSLYTTNQVTGELTPLIGSPFATGITPEFLNFSPVLSNQLLIAIPNFESNNVTVYSIKITPPPVLVSAILNCTTGLVTVTGTQAVANSMIQAFADGTTFIGNGITDNSGNFNFETTTPISATTHTITVEQPANPGEISNSITVSCVIPPTPPAPGDTFLASALTRAIVNKYCPARARFFI